MLLVFWLVISHWFCSCIFQEFRVSMQIFLGASSLVSYIPPVFSGWPELVPVLTCYKQGTWDLGSRRCCGGGPIWTLESWSPGVQRPRRAWVCSLGRTRSPLLGDNLGKPIRSSPIRPGETRRAEETEWETESSHDLIYPWLRQTRRAGSSPISLNFIKHISLLSV